MALKARLEAKRLREEEEKRLAQAKVPFKKHKMKLEILRESVDIEGKHLIAVDKASREHLGNVVKSIEHALHVSKKVGKPS